MAGPGFCRDCLAPAGDEAPRCEGCGSPRLLRHPELGRLALAHVDCDAFFASVEKRDRPDLIDRPVIVGGGRRGVVSTACYVARLSGVRSAMPMFEALRLCPGAVVIRPDGPRYREASRAVRALMEELTPLVEAFSIDEAFLDLSGTERLHGGPPALALARFQRRVEAEIGVTVSVGLSYAKHLAKIASDLDKPRGFAVIGRAEAAGLLASRPAAALPGVGPVTAARLARAGVRTIADLTALDPATLADLAGSDAARLAGLARGHDPRVVGTGRVRRSTSAETTFEADLRDPEALEAALLRLAERVAGQLAAQDACAGGVTLKLKTPDHRLATRSRGGIAPTALPGRLFAVARDLLRAEVPGRAYRLVGVGAYDLRPAAEGDLGDLADRDAPRERAREAAVARLRARFGAGAVERGRLVAARGPGGTVRKGV